MPRRLGKYEILSHVASGGMADVYLARTVGIEGFEKTAAVKRIRPELAKNKELVELFLDEARLAATLHHPNIVQVYDVGVAGENYFFSMEFVHGQDMLAILRASRHARRSLSLDESLSILLGVCAGLHYAHEKTGADGKSLGLVHRDVSPSNVLISYDGAVKLTDFGIARAITRSARTRHGEVRGKLSYMSPEQCQLKPLDRRSDIFALGILAYEFTAETKLFVGSNDYDVMKRIVEMPVVPPSVRRPGYPQDLERIVMRALSRNPDERYATVEEMQLALEDFARERKLATSPITLSRFLGTLFKDHVDAWQRARLGTSVQTGAAHTLPQRLSPTGTELADTASDFVEPPRPGMGSSGKRYVMSTFEPLRGHRTRKRAVVLGVCLVCALLTAAVVRPWKRPHDARKALPVAAESSKEIEPGAAQPALADPAPRPPPTSAAAPDGEDLAHSEALRLEGKTPRATRSRARRPRVKAEEAETELPPDLIPDWSDDEVLPPP